MAGPVVPWASLLGRFHLRANFVGRECRQEARATFGSKQAAPGESEPFESTVKSKDGHRPPLPACEPGPLAVLTWLAGQCGCLRLQALAPRPHHGEQVAWGPASPAPLSASHWWAWLGRLAQGVEMILFSASDSLFSPHSC